jgi:hypothetical protein
VTISVLVRIPPFASLNSENIQPNSFKSFTCNFTLEVLVWNLSTPPSVSRLSRKMSDKKFRERGTNVSRWLQTIQFLVHGFFYPEDGVDTFLRNVGSHKIYTAPHPRIRHSSLMCVSYVSYEENFWKVFVLPSGVRCRIHVSLLSYVYILEHTILNTVMCVYKTDECHSRRNKVYSPEQV